jgi:hypothetical protein
MTNQVKRNLSIIVAVIGGIGIVFNLFQIIVIIAGGYNRNPNITAPLLATLDAIALTAIWLLVSVVILVFAIRYTRRLQ